MAIASTMDDRFLQEVVLSAGEGIVTLDESGRIVVASSGVERLLGYDPSTLIDRPFDELVTEDHCGSLAERLGRGDDEILDATGTVEASVLDVDGLAVPVTLAVETTEYDGQQYTVLGLHGSPQTAVRDDGTTATGSQPGPLLEPGPDATTEFDRETLQRRLSALDEACQQLLTAQTHERVASIVVRAVEEVLDRSIRAVWIYDGEDEVLRPVATSDTGPEIDEEADAEPLAPITDDTVEMTAFRTGQRQFVEDYEGRSAVAHPQLPVDTRLVVPIGVHGVLTVGIRPAHDVDDLLFDVVTLVTRSAAAALDRLERDRHADDRLAAMDVARDGLALLDGSMSFVYANEPFATMHGYDDPIELYGSSWDRVFDRATVNRLHWDVLPAVWKHGRWRGETTGRRADGTTFPQELTVDELEDDRFVCVARDRTHQSERERQLEGLNRITRELMHVEDRREIARLGAEAVEELLDQPIACVRLFDTDTDRLEIAGTTEEARRLVESRSAYDLGSTYAGQALRTGENVVHEGVDDELTDSTATFTSLNVPIGEYGTLSVVVRDGLPLDDHDVGIAELLAVTIETALFQADRTHLLRARRNELRQQRDQLETLDRINTLVQEIGCQLGEAITREDLERTICEQLTESSLYQRAWIGGLDVTDDRLVLHASAGVDEDYLEAIERMPLAMVGGGAVQAALETGTVEVVRRYQVADSDVPLVDAGAHDGYEAVAAIPLGYGDRFDCVLVVTSTRVDVFVENAIDGFEALGKMAGFAINATRHRELLLSDEVVELEFEVAGGDAFYLDVTAELDCRCRFVRAVPLSDGNLLFYHRVEDADPDAVLELARASRTVEDARVTDHHDDGVVLQTTTSQSIAHIGVDVGATLQSVTAENGRATVVFEAPSTVDVRELASGLTSTFATVDLVGKRELERSVRTADGDPDAREPELTEKQQAALEAAYASGYYDWPREITAEELADSMGVSSSTLHQHLRKGERKVLARFFEERESLSQQVR